MEHPLVSIIIPTYNRSHFIGQTIESVIDQTYRHWEMLIIDDGSTDNTSLMISRYKDSRIQYHRIDHCGVIGKVRNVGMELSNGDYLAFLDSDDLWRNDKLEFQLSLLSQYPDVSFIFSNGVHFGDEESLPAELENLFVGDAFLPMIEEERFIFFVPSLMFKREVFIALGPINEGLISGGDIDYYFRMSQIFKAIFTNERLVKIRKHKQGTSRGFEMVAYLEFIIMVKQFFQDKKLTKKQYSDIIARQYYRLGLAYLKQKQAVNSINNFLKFNSIKPFNYKGWIRLLQAGLIAIFRI